MWGLKKLKCEAGFCCVLQYAEYTARVIHGIVWTLRTVCGCGRCEMKLDGWFCIAVEPLVWLC